LTSAVGASEADKLIAVCTNISSHTHCGIGAVEREGAERTRTVGADPGCSFQLRRKQELAAIVLLTTVIKPSPPADSGEISLLDTTSVEVASSDGSKRDSLRSCELSCGVITPANRFVGLCAQSATVRSSECKRRECPILRRWHCCSFLQRILPEALDSTIRDSDPTNMSSSCADAGVHGGDVQVELHSPTHHLRSVGKPASEVPAGSEREEGKPMRRC